jgi:hypothetical protein
LAWEVGVKRLLIGLALGVAAQATAAQAQHPTPAAAPAVVAKPTPGRLSIDSTFLQLATDPRTAAVMKKRMPGLFEQLEQNEEVRAMMGGITVREMSIDQDHGKALTPQVLAMLDAEFAAAQTASPAPGAAPATTPRTGNLQGQSVASQRAWMDKPAMHAFYELSKKTLANGPAKVDMAAYQAQSMVLFGEFAKSMNVAPASMQDHLKLIPGQVVQIYKDDPHSLDTFDTFILAMIGPD